MPKITLENISNLNLTLNSYEKICERGSSKTILKNLEKKYRYKSDKVCWIISGEPMLYQDVSLFYIPKSEKDIWFENYLIFVKSSFVYKFWIFFYLKVMPIFH